MSAPQGIISYPGLTEFILSAQFPLQHGISPSICTMICTPMPANIVSNNEQGTLEFRYGNVRVTCPDCKIDSVRADKNEDGFERWMVTILDRRWKWKFAGFVSGHYNVRKGEVLVGQTLVTPTVRSAKQLAEVCLDAMGETRYDTSEFPKDIFPEVEWDFTNAAEALAQLADKFGFRVVLEISNRVALRKVGKGKQLPNTGDEIQLSRTIDPPERPDELIFAGAPNRHQFDLELECVLRDFDGQYRNIFDLSYGKKDASGRVRWGASAAGHFTADEIAASPKLQLWNNYITTNLYRTWRIKEPFKVEVWMDNKVKLLSLSRINICPLEQTLIDAETNDKDVVDAGGLNRRAFVEESDPIIYGLWSAGNHAMDSNYHVLGLTKYESDPTGEVQTLKDPLNPFLLSIGKCAKALYPLAYDINFEAGYVQFADCAIRYKPVDAIEDSKNASITRVHVFDAGGVPFYTEDDTFADVPAGAVFQTTNTIKSWGVFPARLWLRMAFAVRYNQNEGSPYLYAPVSRKLPGKPLGAGVEYVRAPDIRYWIYRRKDGPLYDNAGLAAFPSAADYPKAAKQYLDAKQFEYDVDDSDSREYCGFKDINPDGAIQQVTYEVVAAGFAYTRASRNKEEVFTGVSYTERRIYEKAKALFDEMEKRKVGA